MTSRAPLIGLVVVLLVGVAFFFLLYQPRNDDLDEVHDEITQLESERSTLNNELHRLEDIEAREVEFRASLARLEEYIPSGIAQSALIRQMQLSADQSGVDIAAVSFGDPEPVEEAPPTGVPQTVLASIGVSVTVDGGYFQMVDFLRRVEVEVDRAVLVRSLSVIEGEDEFPQLSTTWNGNLFAVVPDTSVTAEPEGDGAADDVEGDGGDGDDTPGDDGEPDGGDTGDDDLEAGDVS